MNKEMRLSEFSVAVYAGLLDRIKPEKRNPVLEILNSKAQMGVLLNRQWKTNHHQKTTDLEELVFDSASKTMKLWTDDQYKEMEIDRAVTVPFETYNISLEQLSRKLESALEENSFLETRDIYFPSKLCGKN